jgi:hypothetical protein
VTTDLDTLLTALYVLAGDHVIPSGRRRRPGHPKKLADAELVCLAVAQVLPGARSGHHWLRMCYGRLGHCAAYSRWYWGLKLYLLTTAEGMPAAWCLADPKIGEREIAQELPGHARDTGALRDGMIVLCDKGLAGREMERYAADQVKVLLVRPDRKDEPRRYGNLGGMRQWIESVNDTLNGQLDLERHGGRTPAGVFARIAQRLLALAACIWHNWRTGADDLRSLTAYDH